jgi:hypothetical protein
MKIQVQEQGFSSNITGWARLLCSHSMTIHLIAFSRWIVAEIKRMRVVLTFISIFIDIYIQVSSVFQHCLRFFY